MSVKVAKKIQRNELSDDKKRSTEDKNSFKKSTEKKLQKENEKEKKNINWEEEKDILQQFLRQKYPLSNSKISKIIEEKAEKYINMDEYKSFFLKYQSRNLSENIKKSKSKKLSNAPEEIKSYFDSEAKESNSASSSDDEDEEEIDDGIESEKTISDDEDDESSNTRKRKSEFSTLDEATPKKKETPVAKWLPNGDKVMI
jgi:hypothetical protein